MMKCLRLDQAGTFVLSTITSARKMISFVGLYNTEQLRKKPIKSQISAPALLGTRRRSNDRIGAVRDRIGTMAAIAAA
jgi:hypothetical protein